ncbi:MAG: signal peptide peptidase SppA [Chlorobi bacterium]|nr:signal peptide peptidase SppA [Chlorobiota bacterium]
MKSFLKYTLATILGVFISAFLFTLISFGILGMLISSTEKTVEVSSHTVLHFKLNAQVPERTPTFPFSSNGLFSFDFTPIPGLNDILHNIKKAAADDHIDGIYIETGLGYPGIATIEEIRNALLAFRKSGKFVITYCPDILLQPTYYLATASDSIFLNPAGMMQFTGLRAEIMYYKEALDKLGVEVQVVKHGKFKSAVEPYIRKNMSSENREQLGRYLGTVWNHILDTISADRGVTVEELNRLADNLSINSAEAAVDQSLIDGLKYKDEILTLLQNLTGRAGKDVRMVAMSKYSSVPDPARHGFPKEKIAVIYGEGAITTGMGSEMNIGADRFAGAIRKARKDSTIKAIVLRINSPGGSALASDIIWREVMLAQQVKPVVASMGNYAASGGYYILAAADKVVAQPVTLTGSIGVFGLIPNAGKLLNQKLGITFDVEKTNRYADFGSIYRPLSPGERDYLTLQIENTYSTFVTHVSEGRNLRKTFVDSIGQGRIWSGVSGKELGLVDQLGGIDDALALAADLAGIETYRIVELPKLEDPYQKILKQLSGDIHSGIFTAGMKELGWNADILLDLKKKDPLQMRLPYGISIH